MYHLEITHLFIYFSSWQTNWCWWEVCVWAQVRARERVQPVLLSLHTDGPFKSNIYTIIIMYIFIAYFILRPLKHAEKESKNLVVFEDYLVSKTSPCFSLIKQIFLSYLIAFKFSLSPRTTPSLHCPLWGGKEAHLFPRSSPCDPVCPEAVCRDLWESRLVGQAAPRGSLSLWAHVYRRGPHGTEVSMQGCHWTIRQYVHVLMHVQFALHDNDYSGLA